MDRRVSYGWLGAVLAFSMAGCSAAGGEAPPKKPIEGSGATRQALILPPRADCNANGTVTRTVTAQNIGGQNVSYIGSVYDLFNELQACASDGGTLGAQCAQQLSYTEAIYADIPGAAAYYYRVADTTLNGLLQYWIAIPIVDNTTVTPSFYSSYPGPSVIHTPGNGTPTVYHGTPVNSDPFWLCDSDGPCGRADHHDLWSVVEGPYNNTTTVQGRVKPDLSTGLPACVAIVDPNGNFLDYSAELEEHDPNGCGGCRY